MKLLPLMLAVTAALFTSCHSEQEAGRSSAVYKADLGQSHITWTGSKPGRLYHGTMMLKRGSLTVSDHSITAGSFIIDLNTLKVDDQDTGVVHQLVPFLKSSNFFDAMKYPSAGFELLQVRPGLDDSARKNPVMKGATHTVVGNFTLNGITKTIAFPAKISVNDNAAAADAYFNIDRTLWGLVYGNDQRLGSNFIRPEVNISLHIIANR
jgi:polyisoprenoid-binding protein YceI